MKEYEERTPTTKASQRLERTDLLLSQLPTMEGRGAAYLYCGLPAG